MSKAIWHWNSTSNPWCPSQQPQWTKFSDSDNETMENAYQQNRKHVVLDSHIIDFEKKVQINKLNSEKQRPIKRILLPINDQIREEKFFIQPKLIKTFQSYNTSSCRFIQEWLMNNFHTENDLQTIVETAAHGIVDEGNLLNQQKDGQKLAEQLLEVKNQTKENIYQCCIRLYTQESFLYKVLNKTLREDDLSKVNTLGSFCYLLFKSISFLKNSYHGTVYRGAQLDSDMIESYKQALNDGCRSWNGFTSTSQNRHKAEKFGNVLFIIEILKNGTAIDVSSLSDFPNEEEVLINAGWNFSIQNIQLTGQGKTIVYIKQDF